MTTVFSNSAAHRGRRLIGGIAVLASLLAVIASNIVGAQAASLRTETDSAVPRGQVSADGALSLDDFDKLGLEKIAEMTAMVRHNENCPNVPNAWSAAYLLLLVSRTPPEPVVEAKEKETLALRSRIGEARWCVLYRVEMDEAYLAARLAVGE